MSKLLLFLFLLPLFSCQKSLEVKSIASNLAELSCNGEARYCKSSLDVPTSIQLFKLIGDDILDNISSIEKVALRHGLQVISKTSESLAVSNENFLIEFWVADDQKSFLIRAQNKNAPIFDFLIESPIKLIEKIKFDFFQKNY